MATNLAIADMLNRAPHLDSINLFGLALQYKIKEEQNQLDLFSSYTSFHYLLVLLINTCCPLRNAYIPVREGVKKNGFIWDFVPNYG